MTIRAMAFDLDGTLVQTEKLKARSYARAATRLDPALRETAVVEAYRDVTGRSRREVATHLLAEFGLEEPAASLTERYRVDAPWQAFVGLRLEYYERMLADDDTIRENRWPHALALVETARARCDRLGLATMSHAAQAHRVLSVLAIENEFDVVATRDDVKRAKPDPEIYEWLTRQLETPPEHCLAIEDSPAGVASAHGAGLRCIAVPTPFTRAALRDARLPPDVIVVDDAARLVAVVDRVLRGVPPGAAAAS